jgi:uracil-DNA glycosylase
MDVVVLKKVFGGINKKYKDILGRKLRPELKIILENLENEMKEYEIVPPVENMFECFKKIENIKIIIIGQDPFIRPGQANGFAFSVPKTVSIPPSTHNIYKCLIHHGFIKEKPTHGNLENWASQGVLLLNSALTTRLGKSAAHDFWSKYTNALIKELDEDAPIYILLGEHAKRKAKLITNPKSVVLTWGHPSSLHSVNQIEHPENFKYCDCFTKANEALIQRGLNPINWDPDYVFEPALAVLPVSDAVVFEKMEQVKIDEKQNIIDEKNATLLEKLIQYDTPANTLPYMKADNISSTIKDGNITIHIFTDGAAKNNAKPAICTAGWGYYIVGENPVVCKWANGDVKREPNLNPSNQRGELMGIMNGLKEVINVIEILETQLKKDKHGNNSNHIQVILISDSEYSLKIITEWWKKWVAKNELHTKKNLDIIRPMMEYADLIKRKAIFKTKHVNSHKNEPVRGTYEWFLWYGNEIADRLASSGISV